MDAALLFNAQIRASGGELPTEIIVIPDGVPDAGRTRLDVIARDGRPPLYVDSPTAVVESFNATGRPIALDIDHNSVLGFGDTRARAQIHALRLTNGGLPIVGDLRWTKIGREEFAGEDGDAPPYSMLSPGVEFDDRRNIVGVYNLALTNNAALVDTPILFHAQRGRRDMSNPTLIAMLSATALAAIGTPDNDADANKAIENLHADNDRLAAERDALKTAAQEASTSAETLSARVAQLEAAANRGERMAMLDAAAREGKVTPAQREKFSAMKVDNTTLSEILSTMTPRIEQPAQPSSPDGMLSIEHDGKTYKLTADEAKMYEQHKALGIKTSPKHIIATRVQH